MRRLLAAGLVAASAACGSPDAGEQPAQTEQGDAATGQLSNAQATLLESTDCRTVAQAYFDALALREFDFAARFWDDPVIDDARLAALFIGYGQPRVEIGEVREEGAAGSLHCTVTGTLSDLANPAQPREEGAIVLQRANDVPGASAEQLRWTIRSSTFVEEMERSIRGEPA
jgi:hypothetical protein